LPLLILRHLSAHPGRCFSFWVNNGFCFRIFTRGQMLEGTAIIAQWDEAVCDHNRERVCWSRNINSNSWIHSVLALSHF
jgi:hypothetical protein